MFIVDTSEIKDIQTQTQTRKRKTHSHKKSGGDQATVTFQKQA